MRRDETPATTREPRRTAWQRGRALGASAHRPAIIAADQAVSSTGNFLLQLAVIRGADATSLAWFGVTYSVYWLALGTMRALVFEPLLVLAAQRTEDEAAAMHRAALTLTLGCSLAVALLTGGGAALAPSPGRIQLALLAAGLVPLLLVDCLRYVAISSGVVARALALDGSWLVAQLAAFAVALALDAGPPAFLALWCATSAVGLVLSAGRLRSAFARPPAAWGHWRTSRGLGLPGAGEFAVASGLQQLLPTLLFVVGGGGTAAAYRVAQTMVSPVNVLSSAAVVAALPRAAEHFAARRYSQVLRVAATLAGALSAVGVLVALAYAVLPLQALTAVLGDLAVDGRPVAVLLGVQFTVYGVQLGALLVLRSARRARLALAVSCWTAPLLLLGPVMGAAVGSAVWAAAGFLVATLLSLGWWLWAARRSVHQAPPAGPVGGGPPAGGSARSPAL